MQGGCSLDACVCSLSCTREPEQVQRRSKALCLLEALLLADNAAARDYFSREMHSVQALLSSPQATLKDKARKVVTLLGGDVGEAAPRAERASPARPQATPAADLMGSAAVAAAPADNGLISLIDSPELSAAAAPASLFAGLELPAAAPSPPAAPAPAPAPTPAPAPAPAPAAPLTPRPVCPPAPSARILRGRTAP